MENNTKRDLPGQLSFIETLYPDRALKKGKPDPKGGTVDDLRDIFGEYTCKSLRHHNAHPHADAYGFYCESNDCECIYPNCNQFEPVKR